jgi:hypothetical protein
MRFTIRDLLWLTLLVAVVVAWRVDRGRIGKDLNLLKEPAHLTPKRTHGGVI